MTRNEVTIIIDVHDLRIVLFAKKKYLSERRFKTLFCVK